MSSKNFPGRKWLLGTSYLTPAAVATAEAQVAKARNEGHSGVGVRPASYIGEDCDAVIIVTTGHGMSIYSAVTRGGFTR
jgi:hypothetical protein